METKTQVSQAAFQPVQNDIVLHALLDMGQALLICGAEVHRVEDTLTRIARSFGADSADIFVITSAVIVTLRFPDGRETTLTRRILSSGDTDFYKMEQLNALSRECGKGRLSPEELKKRIQHIVETTSRRWQFYLGSAFASGCFAIFFGGTLFDGLAAAAFSMLICLMMEYFAPVCLNKVTFYFFSTLFIGCLIFFTARLFPALRLDKIIIGDIMLMIPGISLTNAVRDMLLGDTLSGTMRLVESLLWAGAQAAGFMAAIWLMGLLFI